MLQNKVLLMTSMYQMFFHHTIIFLPTHFIHKMLSQKQKLERGGGGGCLTLLLGVNIVEIYPMERYDKKQPFDYELNVLCLTRRCTTVDFWVVTALRLVVHN